jgi:hypothetical protein
MGWHCGNAATLYLGGTGYSVWDILSFPQFVQASSGTVQYNSLKATKNHLGALVGETDASHIASG